MHAYTARAGRWPLALTLLGLAALAACADEPVAPDTAAKAIAKATEVVATAYPIPDVGV